MTYTLADAIRDEFNRTHPFGKNTLLCEQCRQRKDREDFRETPWHGRAADCKSCEGMRWVDELRLRQTWELEQERAKVVMLVRHIQRLRLQRLIMSASSSADEYEKHVAAFREAVARRSLIWGAAWTTALTDAMPEPERRKRARLTLQMERKR